MGSWAETLSGTGTTYIKVETVTRSRMTKQDSDKSIPEAAKRALEEAEERRRRADWPTLPKELGGRDGPEPVRYGDWERKGIAVDF